MPVRKIPKNYLHVTGKFSSRKNGDMNGFESPLEKDYMMLLEFDESVEGFEEQPVTVPVPGVPKGYTPDLLVRYHPDPATGQSIQPRLAEVKHTSDLSRHAEDYARKFALADQYALERGWIFVVVTEKEIRTQRLKNVKFLREYRNVDLETSDVERVLDVVRATGAIRYAELLDKLGDSQAQLHDLPVLWHLVLSHRLTVDLDAVFDADTVFRIGRVAK